MGKQLHTQGPWMQDGHYVITQGESVIAFCGANEEDARRIVACKSRCEGIDTEILENSPDLATAFMSAENARLMQVNAELLAAAKQTIEENLYLADGDNCTLKVLKDAIAKAEAI